MKRTLFAALVNMLLLTLVYWLTTTEAANRAVDTARAWMTLAKMCWQVTYYIGRIAINAELKYHTTMENTR